MPLFCVKFKRWISGYGGPGSPWATELLYFQALSSREANKFFLTLITPNERWCSQGIMNYQLGTFYRAVLSTHVDESKFHMFSVFKPKVYLQAELTAMAAEKRVVHERFRPIG